MTEAELVQLMARLGIRIDAAQARELLPAHELLEQMKARVRSEGDLYGEPAHRFIVPR
jgi:hypothetical protein